MNVLTTLTHLGALFPVVSTDYSAVIILSTTLSVLWHEAGEPGGALFYADYGAAGLWCLFDLHYSDYDINVLLLNLAVGILNPVFGDTYHFLWHLLSASKALVVAYLIQREMRSRSERAPFIVHGFASNDENRNETWDPSMDAERQYSMPWP